MNNGRQENTIELKSEKHAAQWTDLRTANGSSDIFDYKQINQEVNFEESRRRFSNTNIGNCTK